MAQGVQDRREIPRSNVVKLDPLLEHGPWLHARVDQLIKLAAVEASGTGEPHARQLHADQVVLPFLDQEEVPAIRMMNGYARIVDCSEIRPREVSLGRQQDRRRD